jgi:PAS domain S-box-containing protein
MTDREQIRVLLAEDEAPLRQALADLIAGEPGLEVVGTAATAEEAVRLSEQTAPDVALIDVRMPGGGVTAASGISQHSPHTRVLAFSAYEDQATVLALLRAGAVGYLVKGIAPGEVIEAIRRASRGQGSVSIDVISSVIDALGDELLERQQSVEVLRQSEEQFRSLLNSAPDGVVISDAEGQIVLVNDQAEKLFGYPRAELVGMQVEMLLPERFREHHLQHRASYLADARTRPMGIDLELAGRRRDGTEFPVDISLSAIVTAQGRLVTAFVRDVTERRRTHELRRTSEIQFDALLESAPDAVLIVDKQGTIVLANAQTENLFGYTRTELVGQPIEALLPKPLRKRHERHRAGYLAAPKTRPMGAGLDLAGRRKDGTEVPVDISLATTSSDEGPLVTAFIRDISERRRSEIAQRQLAAIVESSDDAIIGNALDGTILSWNHGAERMYGYPAGEVIGRPIAILVPPDLPDELPDVLGRLTRGEEIEQFETKHMRDDKTEIDVVLKISAIKDEGGEITGASMIARDITQAKAQAALERDLAERRALLGHFVAAAEEERRRIADDIHDDSIQAITAAGMRLQILRRSLRDPQQLEFLTELEQTIQLSISRLRHLLFELRPHALDSEGLSAALQMYLEESQDEPTTYTLEDRLRSQPPEAARIILYRIAQEALANVRKHAAAQQVTVSLDERENGFLLRVVDDGVGFTADAATPAPGHLGLVGMRERATLAGGFLRVDSQPSSGTTVEVWVPADLSQLWPDPTVARNGNASGRSAPG